MEPEERAGYSFKNLILWQKAQNFASLVARLVDELLRRRSAESLGSQLFRAAASVGANIAEGHGRFSFAAYRNHLSIAKGSASEARSWIDLASRLSYVTPEAASALDRIAAELIGSLTRRIRALQEQRSRPIPLVPRFNGSGESPSLEEAGRS